MTADVTEVDHLGDGVFRITLPLPFPSPRSVNCYLFEGSGRYSLLDCGVDGDTEYELLGSALRSLGADLDDVRRLIGSHLHVDHIGMAKRIVEQTGCEWVMHASTVTEVAHYNDWSMRRRFLTELVAAAGAPEETVAQFRGEFSRPAWFAEAIPPTHPVEDGDVISLDRNRALQVIYTPGHQLNHLCLIDSRTGRLFSGDHVLPRISPFIPYTDTDSDHLGAYLESLQRIVDLAPRLTYPAHGPTIERGAARAHQILLHHERRIDSMLEELSQAPRTPWQIVETVFRPHLSPLEQRLAFQETMAHLEHLRRTGRVERTLVDGRWWYRQVR